MLLFLSGVHGSKTSSVKVCRRCMQRQYSSHMSMLMEKLLCQHRLLTGKVRVSFGVGGWTQGGMGDGSRAVGRTGGGTVITVGSPETSDTAVAAVHLTHLPLLSHFYWHKSFYRGLDRLFTLSVCDHPPPSIYLPVANSIMRCLSGRSCLSAGCVLNDMSRTLQDHTRKISLSDIWSVLSKLGDVFCVHTYVLAFLYPACMCWHECKSQVQTLEVYIHWCPWCTTLPWGHIMRFLEVMVCDDV